MFSCISVSFETVFLSIFIKKKSILNLIKDIQKFDLLCRWISSQFHRKSERNFLFALIRNEILRKMNYVFVSQQKIIWVQLLEFFHDCSSNDHWDRDKILELIQCYFTWNKIMNDIYVYVVMCSVCQSKAIHYHKFYNQLEFFSVLKNMWNLSFKKISLN